MFATEYKRAQYILYGLVTVKRHLQPTVELQFPIVQFSSLHFSLFSYPLIGIGASIEWGQSMVQLKNVIALAIQLTPHIISSILDHAFIHLPNLFSLFFFYQTIQQNQTAPMNQRCGRRLYGWGDAPGMG